MQITTIPNILIDGQNVYPYSLDFNLGGADPSEVSLKFVNRDGNYSLPITDGERPIKIKIGNFYNFEGYVVATETTSDAKGGKLMSVKYQDSSIVLDKVTIGLKGVHGPGFTTSFFGTQSDNLILVGSQIDPCVDVGNLPVDPCAPVCQEREDREEFDCAQEKATKILQVDYSFNELKAAVSSKVAFGSFPSAINLDYRASYSGSLREVLQNWCGDFGISFYWHSNAIYFFDLSTGVTINIGGLDNGTNVISETESRSIENNSAPVKVVYFGAEGEERSYSCTANSSKALTLTPVTLFDLLAPSSSSGGDDFVRLSYDPQLKNGTNALSYFYDAIILSYYSDKLRDVYFWFEREELNTAADVEDWITADKKPIQALGALKPMRVIHKDSTDTNIQAAYTKMLALLDPEQTANMISKNGYFVIAEYDETRHNRYSDMEAALANDFLGKYWIRLFNDGAAYSFDAPDGNVKYYSNGSEIQFPFLNHLPSSVQQSSEFLQRLIESAEVEDGEITSTTSHGRFILMDRTAVWSPAKNSQTIQDLLKTIEPFNLEKTEISTKDFKGIGLANTAGTNIFSPNISTFIAYPRPPKLDLEITKSGEQEENHPIDSKNTGLSVELNGAIARYGLRSSAAPYFIVKSNSTTLQIFGPTQAGFKFGSDYGGYIVVANGATFTNNIKVVLPKKEVILGDSVLSTQNDVASQIIFKDATQNLVKFIESSGTQTCAYNDEQIRALLLRFNSRQKMASSIIRVTKTFEISGIPEARYTPADGLQSFSIGMSDGGVKTSLSFSNIPSQNRSEILEEKRFEEIAALLGKAKNYFRK